MSTLPLISLLFLLVHGISRKIYTSHMLGVRFMGVESKEDSAGVTGRLSKEGEWIVVIILINPIRPASVVLTPPIVPPIVTHCKEQKLIMFLLCQMPIPLSRSRRPYTRLNRNLPPSPGGKGRPRRSLSSDFGAGEKKELSAGQKKAAEDKKGSRHADVIDAWDPTGLGSASESPSPGAMHDMLIGSVASFWTIRCCCPFPQHQSSRQSSTHASFPRSRRTATRSNDPYFYLGGTTPSFQGGT